jgi:hypothetical protein
MRICTQVCTDTIVSKETYYSVKRDLRNAYLYAGVYRYNGCVVHVSKETYTRVKRDLYAGVYRYNGCDTTDAIQRMPLHLYTPAYRLCAYMIFCVRNAAGVYRYNGCKYFFFLLIFFTECGRCIQIQRTQITCSVHTCGVYIQIIYGLYKNNICWQGIARGAK